MKVAKTAQHRRTIVAAVTAVEASLPAGAVTAAVDAVLTGPAAARELAAALAADPDVLAVGAPPVVGRLVDALRARGSRLPEPACAMCAATGRTLTRSDAGGVCRRCWDRQQMAACARCGVVKLVRGRTSNAARCVAPAATDPGGCVAAAGGPAASPAAPATGSRTFATPATGCRSRSAAAAAGSAAACRPPVPSRSA